MASFPPLSLQSLEVRDVPTGLTWNVPLPGASGVAMSTAGVSVIGNGEEIANRDVTPSPEDGTHFGAVAPGQTVDRQFDLVNDTGLAIPLTGTPRVRLSGPGAGAFRVLQLPSESIPANGSTSFVLRLAPAGEGHFTADVTIEHGLGTYTFTVFGEGFVAASNTAPVARSDNMSTMAGRAVAIDVLSNDFDREGDAIRLVTVAKASGGQAVARADGQILFTPDPEFVGTTEFDYSIRDTGDLSSTGRVTVSVTAPPAPSTDAIAVGSDRGGSAVSFLNPDGSVRYQLTPFSDFTGGVRTAAGDFNGDGIADLVVGTGPGGPSHVKVFDGVSQDELFSVGPFEASFTGGVYVAVGDMTGDGRAELAITPDEGGGPRVRMFNGNGFVQIADFFGIDDPNFRGGARAAIGDLNGDGKGDLVVAAGFGGGPRVAAFDGARLGSDGGPKLFGDFFAFEETLRNGIFVAAGDVNGDGYADVVAGGGPGGGPRVFILDGQALVRDGSSSLTQLGNYFAGDTASRGGVRVAVKNLDGDTKADVVTGAGENAGSRLSAYLGVNTTPFGGTPPTTLDFDAFAGFTGGVFVG